MNWENISFWLTFIGLPTLFGTLLVDLYLRIKNSTKKSKEKKKQEDVNSIKEIVKDVVEPLVEPIKNTVNNIDKKTSVLEEANQAVLRNDLWAVYRHCEKKGYKSDRDMENFSHMYAAYKALNGNSFIDDLKREFNDLENEKEYNRKKAGR